jgi:hypothetical protein
LHGNEKELMALRIKQGLWLSAALAAAAALSAFPASAGQVAKQQKQAAAAGTPVQGSSASWRVMLVIGDDVRNYRPGVFLSHYDFGPRLAKEAERVCRQSFAAVTVTAAMPADPHALDGIDLVIQIQSPVGTHLGGLFTFTQSLSAVFDVRNRRGEELFRVQESDTEKSPSIPVLEDRLGEGVTRKFLQDLNQNPSVRNSLAPPPAPVETKPVLADTAEMDSSGLDVPPPPPWGQPALASAPAGSAGNGRP